MSVLTGSRHVCVLAYMEAAPELRQIKQRRLNRLKGTFNVKLRGKVR